MASASFLVSPSQLGFYHQLPQQCTTTQYQQQQPQEDYFVVQDVLPNAAYGGLPQTVGAASYAGPHVPIPVQFQTDWSGGGCYLDDEAEFSDCSSFYSSSSSFSSSSFSSPNSSPTTVQPFYLPPTSSTSLPPQSLQQLPPQMLYQPQLGTTIVSPLATPLMLNGALMAAPQHHYQSSQFVPASNFLLGSNSCPAALSSPSPSPTTTTTTSPIKKPMTNKNTRRKSIMSTSMPAIITAQGTEASTGTVNSSSAVPKLYYVKCHPRGAGSEEGIEKNDSNSSEEANEEVLRFVAFSPPSQPTTAATKASKKLKAATGLKGKPIMKKRLDSLGGVELLDGASHLIKPSYQTLSPRKGQKGSPPSSQEPAEPTATTTSTSSDSASDSSSAASTEKQSEAPKKSRKRSSRRLIWTGPLHALFLRALEYLGVDRAMPRDILKLMNVRGLKRENVSSHLQKFRLRLARLEEENELHDDEASPIFERVTF